MKPKHQKTNLEDISRSLIATYNNLDRLRSIHSYFDNNSTLNENLAAVESGLDQADLMLTLSGCYSKLEMENQLLQLRVKKLEENNSWVRQELEYTKNKLQGSEQMISQLQVEKQHLEFIGGLQRPKVTDEGIGDSLNSTSNTNQLHDLEHVWNLGSSNSDSGLDEDYYSRDFDISTGPKCHSTHYAKKRVEKANPKPESSPRINVDAAALTRALLVGDEVCPEIRDLRKLVFKYAKEGRTDRAALLCRLSLNKIEESVGREDPVYISALVVLATVHQFQGKFESSISLLKEALKVREDLLSSTHSSVADLHNRMALIFIEMTKFEDAEFHLRKALKIKIIHFGDRHGDVAKQLKNLAILFRRQRKFDEAGQYYNSAAKIYWDRYGPNDPVTTKAIRDSVICNSKYREFLKKC